MKYFKILSALFLFTTLFYACQKEYSVEVNPNTANNTYQWQFTEAGVTYKGKVDTAYVDTLGQFKILSLIGTSADGKDAITLMLNTKNLVAGSYPNCGFSYTRSGVAAYQSDLAILTDTFTINITSIDSNGVVGTFTGKAKDKNGAIHIITAGQFNASFKSNSGIITPPPVLDSGNVVFWAKSSLNNGTNPITVKVEGKTGTIITFDTSKTCGLSGRFTTTLAVGTHSWTATCVGTTISGTVTVVKGACTPAQVDFTVPTGNYFPVTTNSTWTYLNMVANASPDDSITMLSLGKIIQLSGNTYNIFQNSYGQFTSIDSGFYRVNGTMYYQFYPQNAGPLANLNPTATEYKFLDEKTSSWSSGSSTANLGGINVSIKITSTIIGTGSATIGYGSFTDVMRVRNSYLYTTTLSPTAIEVYREEQWYARGVGLIKDVAYSDPINNPGTPSSSYELTSYIVK